MFGLIGFYVNLICQATFPSARMMVFVDVSPVQQAEVIRTRIMVGKFVLHPGYLVPTPSSIQHPFIKEPTPSPNKGPSNPNSVAVVSTVGEIFSQDHY